MTSFTIVPFDRKFDRSAFDCGHLSLNDFLTKFVSQYEKRNIGRTYLAIKSDQKIAGYYTLASSALDLTDLPESIAKRFSQSRIPVLLLGRLAVNSAAQGRGIGSRLLRDAFDRCISVANQIGVFAIFVEAINDDARHFYEKYGFQPLISDPLKLFLPMTTLSR